MSKPIPGTIERRDTYLENCELRLQFADARKQVDHDAMEKLNVLSEEFGYVRIIEGMKQYQRFFILVY